MPSDIPIRQSSSIRVARQRFQLAIVAGWLAACGSGQSQTCPGDQLPRWERFEIPSEAPEDFGTSWEIGHPKYMPYAGAPLAFWREDKLYMWGGTAGGIWTPESDEWTFFPGFEEFAEFRTGLVAFTPGRLHVLNFPVEDPGERDTSVLPVEGFSYEFEKESWGAIPRSEHRVNGLNVALGGHAQFVFVFVAQISESKFEARSALYDIERGVWTQPESPPNGDYDDNAYAMIDGKLVLFGADVRSPDRTYEETLGSHAAVVFDFDTQTWTTHYLSGELGRIPRGVGTVFEEAHPRAVIGERIYDCCAGDDRGYGRVFSYEQMKWSQFDAPVTEGQAYAAGDKLVVLGEQSYLYDPVEDSWTELPEACAPKGDFTLAVWTDAGLLTWSAYLEESDRAQLHLLVRE